MWNVVSVSLEIVLSVQDRCIVCAKCTIGSEKSFWWHMIELLGVVSHVESRFGPFGDSVTLDVR
jgi:hypothetical protein